MGRARENIDAFKEALAKRGSAAQPKAEFPGGAAISAMRHVVVADTEEEAHRVAKPAMNFHLKNINWLRDLHGVTGLVHRLQIPRGATYEECLADGTMISGTPSQVVAEIERQHAELGINYLICYLFLGTMSLAEALRSLALFRNEVMPKIERL
jgi:alkanesulfonate monooxygenase SsuD/methylene tetrahydromethanopterin reductase-like flavin-dependent oxidoreductase (luciferase family)